MIKLYYLLQADFSVSSSGDTYCAVPTKEFALAAKRWKLMLNRHKKNFILLTQSKMLHSC